VYNVNYRAYNVNYRVYKENDMRKGMCCINILCVLICLFGIVGMYSIASYGWMMWYVMGVIVNSYAVYLNWGRLC
jgi:hypothetical protein